MMLLHEFFALLAVAGACALSLTFIGAFSSFLFLLIHLTMWSAFSQVELDCSSRSSETMYSELRNIRRARNVLRRDIFHPHHAGHAAGGDSGAAHARQSLTLLLASVCSLLLLRTLPRA